MFKLKLFKGNIFVYNVDDWLELRKIHRIIGHLIGNTNLIPSLPSKLLPEEALVLLEQNLAQLYENNGTVLENSKEYEEMLLEAQQEEYRTIRKQQLDGLIDKIVAQRRQRGDTRPKEEIFDEELNKSSLVTKDNMLWPILLQNDAQSLTLKGLEDVLPLTNPLKATVYKDLWTRGYYVTSGEKFGSDFLVYYGDPIIHHAIFAIRCIDHETVFTPTELIAFGRLGVSVKKRAVLATVAADGTVNYVTINWIDA